MATDELCEALLLVSRFGIVFWAAGTLVGTVVAVVAGRSASAPARRAWKRNLLLLVLPGKAESVRASLSKDEFNGLERTTRWLRIGVGVLVLAQVAPLPGPLLAKSACASGAFETR